jgi:NitT/TauT family transport system permease protein/taurine transport system permease protein
MTAGTTGTPRTIIRRPPGTSGLLRRAGRLPVVTAAVLILVVAAVWSAAAEASGMSADLFPRPSDAYQAFVELVEEGILPAYIIESLGRWVEGVVLGLVAAIAVATVTALSDSFARMIMPTVSFFYAIAEVAWLPLFVIWFGYGHETVLVCIAYVVFFPVLHNAMVGLRSVPTVHVDAARTLGANRGQVIREVLLPGSLSHIVTGFRVGAAYAFRALIAAEAIAATSGLGFLLFEGRETQQLSRTVVAMIAFGALWIAIERLYLRPLERATVERWGMIR